MILSILTTFEVPQLHYLLTEDFFLNPLISKLTTVYNSAIPKQAKGVGACEFLIMFIIAGVWIFQVSSNSQWGNGRNRMMMGCMYKLTLFFFLCHIFPCAKSSWNLLKYTHVSLLNWIRIELYKHSLMSFFTSALWE